MLGTNSQIPVGLLLFEPRNSNANNRCPFLKATFLSKHGCSIYPDRPLRCRLFPFGRIVRGDTSYFIKQPCFCDQGKVKSYTLAEWIIKAELEPYFRYEAIPFLHCLDLQAYKALPFNIKERLGNLMYDIDTTLVQNTIERSFSIDEIFETVNSVILTYLKQNNCILEKTD